MKLIAKHLDRKNLKYATWAVDSICAFTGERISEGVLVSELVSDVFTDWAYVKYPSEYASVDVALCIGDVIPGKTRNNALRNYSFFASDSELRLLSREAILPLLLAIPETPFRMAVTFNNKKHTSYKTVENVNPARFIITTDVLGQVVFDRKVVDAFLPIVQRWYSIIPEKANAAAQPTYFTKAEIEHGDAHYYKQCAYGLERYEEENEFLMTYRNTMIFKLIIHLLNKF